MTSQKFTKKQEKIFNYLVGEVMKILPGADPEIVKEILFIEMEKL